MAFMSYRRVFNKSGFTIEQYCRLLKLIIYAYFVVLLIQQFCVLVGLPVFLINAYNPTNPWKLNSLAMEPSHTARFVPLLMYSYITIKEIGVKKKYNLKSDFNKDKYIWIAFFWTMITMGSGTAFLFIPIVLLKFLRGRNIVYMALLAILLFFIAYQILPDTIKRTNDTFFATLTLEENKIIEADGSAAYRIVPMMIVAKNVELTKLKGWFGHGIDSSEQLLTETGRLLAAPDKLVGGGMFQLWYEYGFISFVLFVVFSALMCWRKGDWLSVVFWFFLVFMYGINNQMVWITIILLYTNKRFAKLQLKQ